MLAFKDFSSSDFVTANSLLNACISAFSPSRTDGSNAATATGTDVEVDVSTFNFSGTYEKEVEAYVLEEKPRKVKELIKEYCL